MSPAPRYLPALALLLLSLAVAPSPLRAQSDVTPLDPNFRRLPEIARRTGNLNCVLGNREEYGRAVHVVARGARDADPMWIVERVACEPPEAHPDANELLVYRSTGDTIPTVDACYRVGPPEHSSITKLLTSADLDQDGHSDLVCAVRIIGDTSFGNYSAHPTRVVVFWGRLDGRFTLDDTSQIPAMSLLWQDRPRGAVMVGSIADSSYLLIVATISDFAGNDVLERKPPLRIYSLRRGERWGRNGVACRPVWTMWGRPPVLHEAGVQALDHDGDGAMDVAFSFQGDPFAEASYVSVLYGTPHGYPDSASLQTVHLLAAGGRASLLEDITGDGVPELVVHAGGAELLRIYVGMRGRRLLEQYGTGADTARPGDPEWWGRPWATVRLPRAFWTGWGSSLRWIYRLGDGNGDAIPDIWCVVEDYLLCYTTGEWLDEYADGLVDLLPGGLYDSGIYAMSDYPSSYAYGAGLLRGATGTKIVSTTENVRYLGIDRQLPHARQRIHRLPPGTGKPTTAVPLHEVWPWRMDLW